MKPFVIFWLFFFFKFSNHFLCANWKCALKAGGWKCTYKQTVGEVRKGQQAMLMSTQFHCYLVQKTHWNAVFHPAKLASGANYPVGWVQMPHSVRRGGLKWHWARAKTEGGRGSTHTQVCNRHACFPLTSGSKPLQCWGFSSPGFTQLVCFFFSSFFVCVRAWMFFYSQLWAGSRPIQL